MNQLAPCVKFLITLAKLLVLVLVCKGDASGHSRRDGETRLMVFTVTPGDNHCGTPEDGVKGAGGEGFTREVAHTSLNDVTCLSTL